MSDLSVVNVPIEGLEPGKPVHFAFQRGGEDLSGFVLEFKGRLRAYVNRCAHVTFSLDLGDGVVMDPSRKFIMCHVHGARFLPESGECFWGPALGRRLERFPVERQGDAACVQITPEPPDWPAGGK